MVRLVKQPYVWWAVICVSALWTIQAALYMVQGAYEPVGLQIYLMGGLSCLAIILGMFAVKLWKPARPKSAAQLAAEQEAEQERLQQKKFEKAARRETKYLMKRIPEELAIQNRMQHSIATQLDRKGKRKVVQIRLRDACITQTEVWFPLHSRDFPYGTGFHDLLNENQYAIQNLQHGIHRHCRIEIDEKYHHVFLVVSFRNSSGGLPLTVHWNKAYKAVLERSLYTVVMGTNKSGKIVVQDLTVWPHGLVLGGTGNGKTTWMKQALISLLRRCTPDELELVLIDLKEIEFYAFSKLPHIREYVDNPEEAVPAIQRLVAEMEDRFNRMKDVAHDISGYNRARPKDRMSRIFLWVDELARLTRGGDAKRRKDAVAEILTLVSRGRAVGIHVLLGTQSVSKQVLPMDVTANIDGRLCFGVRNMSASILAVGNGDAVGLTPPGRGAMARGSKTVYVQSPIASDVEIEDSLKMAAAGQIDGLERLRERETAPENKKWDTDDLYLCGFNEFGGYMNADKIYETFPRMARDEMRRRIKARDGRYFAVNGYWAYQTGTQKPLNGAGRIARHAAVVQSLAMQPNRLLRGANSDGR